MISIKCWKTALLNLLIFPTMCCAQVPIETLIQKTLIFHPEVIAAQAKKDSLLKLVEQTKIRPNPELGVSLGGKNDPSNTGITYEAIVKQTLVNADKINAKKSLAQIQVLEQELELKKIRNRLHYDVLTHLYEWNRYTSQAEFNQKRIQKLNWLQKYLASRPFVAPQKRLEIKLIEGHLKELEAEKLHLNSQKLQAKSALDNLIPGSLPENHDIIYPKIDFTSIPNSQALQAKITSQNAEIQAIRLQLQQVELETIALQAEAQSDMDIFGRYASETASETERFLSVGIGIELNFANKNRFAIQAQSKKSDVFNAELEKVTKENTLKFQQALLTLKNAQEILTLYDDAWIKQIESGFDHAIEDFKKGQTELLSVLELESQWYQSSVKSYEAKTEFIHSWSSLLQLSNETKMPGEII